MASEHQFHEGERTVQLLAGETAIAHRNSAVFSDTVIGPARPFIARQFMVAVASTDADGAVWSSLLFGTPGFAHADDGHAIRFDLPAGERDEADPLWQNIAQDRDVGLLFIELLTRRRYRINGSVQRLDKLGFDVSVQEAYANCPKYIQRRQLRQLGEPRLPVPAAHGNVPKGAVERIIGQADTLFVASRHAASGADASHRGGQAGFARLVDGTTLRIPDFPGNSLFNTLGNIEADARAGLCIPDFDNGQLLQLTGSATVLWNQDDPRDETGGTQRYWEFKVERWILRDMPQQLAWDYLDASPFNPGATQDLRIVR